MKKIYVFNMVEMQMSHRSYKINKIELYIAMNGQVYAKVKKEDQSVKWYETGLNVEKMPYKGFKIVAKGLNHTTMSFSVPGYVDGIKKVNLKEQEVALPLIAEVDEPECKLVDLFSTQAFELAAGVTSYNIEYEQKFKKEYEEV